MAEENILNELTNEEKLNRANSLKEVGNSLLTAGKFIAATEKYSEALDIFPTAIIYSNRAQALIKLEAYGQAISDANEALKLDPKYIKAYYRRGSANYALGKLKEALKDFKAVTAIVPNDPDAINKKKTCEKLIRAEAFQKAIETEDPVEQTVDLGSILVDDTYDGPRIPLDSDGKAIYSMDLVREIIEYFRQQKLLHRKYVYTVLLDAIKLLQTLPTLLELDLPRSSSTGAVNGNFIVCGDTHGQYYDLLNIFEIGGYPSENNFYLFNGDYVDRGSFSFENVFTLLLIKLALPNSLHLLRGNHETKNLNNIYGFTGEVKHKYDDRVMNVFTKLFRALPLSAVISKKVFVVHGGLSTENNVKLSDIAAISRFKEPTEGTLMSELLWSDPQPQKGKSPSKRGVGFSFGPDYTERFLKENNLQLLIRSHEVRDEGYEIEHEGNCITVFSAPNYCDQMGNKGAFVRFESEDMKPNFVQFSAVPHPNIPPMKYAGNMFAL